MSAECSKCGCDIVYPEGTWPIGECPRCASRERLGEWLEKQGYNELDISQVIALVFANSA